MGGRGVHFAVSAEQATALLEAEDDDALMEVVEEIEEAWDEEHVAESDKAWDAIHRCLTDGQLLYDNGEYPLNQVICGGKQLHAGSDYTVAFVSSEAVKDVASALDAITEGWMRERYDSLIDPEEYDGVLGDQDFAYAWQWFQRVRDLYRRAARTGRAVVFTVDA